MIDKKNLKVSVVIALFILSWVSPAKAIRNPFESQLPEPVEPTQIIENPVTNLNNNQFKINNNRNTDIINNDNTNTNIFTTPTPKPLNNQKTNVNNTHSTNNTSNYVENLNTPPEPIIPPELTVQGIIWQTDRPQAIINNNVVDIGDSILGTKIITINKNSIQFKYENEMFTITP